jgi:hypothetical protein
VAIDGTIYRDTWSKELPEGAEIFLLPRLAGVRRDCGLDRSEPRADSPGSAPAGRPVGLGISPLHPCAELQPFLA